MHGRTIDRDSAGGNPFATALIASARTSRDPLPTLLRDVRTRTTESTNGVQQPVWSLAPPERKWTFALDPGRRDEVRVALVLIAFDYRAFELGFLAGAAHDERRISALFAEQGFSVQQGVGQTRRAKLAVLRQFAYASANADAAVIYSTGHGIHLPGETYLLPGDFPAEDGFGAAAVQRRGIPVTALARACQARRVNLVFFAGCRSPHEP